MVDLAVRRLWLWTAVVVGYGGGLAGAWGLDTYPRRGCHRV